MSERDKNIRQRVRNVLIGSLCLGSFSDTDRLKEDLNADSLDSVEMSMDLEEEFEIDIDLDDFDNIKTVQHVINLVHKKLSAK